MISGENCSSNFREEVIKKNNTILYMYTAQGQGQIMPQRTKIRLLLKPFTTLIIHCRF